MQSVSRGAVVLRQNFSTSKKDSTTWACLFAVVAAPFRPEHSSNVQLDSPYFGFG
jgi:hypothetical protein